MREGAPMTTLREGNQAATSGGTVRREPARESGAERGKLGAEVALKGTLSTGDARKGTRAPKQ